MDTGAHALAAEIGSRVKRERNARGWTLDRLAEAASVSRRMVVNVEQGAVNPTVGILLRLSDALGIGLPALVEPPEQFTGRVTRSGEGATLWHGPHGGSGVLVAGTQPPDVLELWDWRLEVGETHESDAHAAGTREVLQVRAGSIEVRVSGQSHVLDTGDALTFHGDQPHAYRHHGDIPARFSLAVFEPDVGTAAQSGTHVPSA